MNEFRSMRIVFAVLLIVSPSVKGVAQETQDTVTVHVPIVEKQNYSLPTEEDVHSIVAELYNMDGLLYPLPNVGPFVVPKERYAEILEYFRHPKIDQAPAIGWKEIGSLKVTDSRGIVTRVSYIWPKGKGALMYSINGIRCIDGRVGRDVDDALTLDLRLRKTYEHMTGHIVTKQKRTN